jgi:hypothetical protein
MIIIENFGTAERRYSDLGVKLRQVETDTLWNDAVNAIPCRFTYEETDLPIEHDDADAEELLNIIVGGEAT